MSDMYVSPALLRGIAGATEHAATSIKDAKLATAVKDSCAGLPSSSLAWAAGMVSVGVDVLVGDLQQDLLDAVKGVQGAAVLYQVTEDELAASFTKILGD